MAYFSGSQTATSTSSVGVFDALFSDDVSQNPLYVALNSYLSFAEGTSPTLSPSSWGGANAGLLRLTGLPAGPFTAPENFNSRSSSTGIQNQYGFYSSVTPKIALPCNSVSFIGWRGDYRRAYIGQGTGTDSSSDVIVAGAAAAISTEVARNLNLFFSDQPINRIASKLFRRSRTAFWSFSDCTTLNHQKTGSGAFQLFAPHALNDGLTWIDSRAFGIGTRGDEWSMSLFGGPPPAVIRYWPWFVAQRK